MAERLVIVSGAARGIGKATVETYLAAGYSCIAIDNDATALTRLHDRCDPSAAPRLHCLELDLAHARELPEFGLSELAAGAQSVTLVNNLGGSQVQETKSEFEWTAFEETARLNVRPAVFLTRACLPILRQCGQGYVVNISSVAGRSALASVGPEYAAAKAALLGLTRRWAVEYAADNILVNTICPGIVATERILARWASRPEADNASALARIPLGRLGDPVEVARAIYFLGSPENTYATGAVLDINGGMYLP